MAILFLNISESSSQSKASLRRSGPTGDTSVDKIQWQVMEANWIEQLFLPVPWLARRPRWTASDEFHALIWKQSSLVVCLSVSHVLVIKMFSRVIKLLLWNMLRKRSLNEKWNIKRWKFNQEYCVYWQWHFWSCSWAIFMCVLCVMIFLTCLTCFIDNRSTSYIRYVSLCACNVMISEWHLLRSSIPRSVFSYCHFPTARRQAAFNGRNANRYSTTTIQYRR